MNRTKGNTNGKTDNLNLLTSVEHSMSFLDSVTDNLINNPHNPYFILYLDDEHMEDFNAWVKNREADAIQNYPVNFDGGPTIKYQPPHSHLQNHSLDGLPHCDYSPIERVGLILKHYDPVDYRGLICPINGNTPYTADTIQCKKEGTLKVKKVNGETIYSATDNKRYSGKKAIPFNQKSALLNHVTNGSNLGIYLNKKECKFIAFDIDSHSEETKQIGNFDESLNYSVACMIGILYGLGLTPFLYFSGQKGYHCDIFFDKPVSVDKLNILNSIILTKHKELDGSHVDAVYPSGRSYRVFGCFHHKTGYFTQAQDIEINEDYTEVSWTSFDYNGSWKLFANVPVNKAVLVDAIIAAHPNITTPPKMDKKTNRHNANYSPKGHYYNISIIKKIYETGLYGEYRRYNSAFTIGRYFRYILNLTEEHVKEEADKWLKRHYPDLCNNHNGLIPFAGSFILKSTYDNCVEETIQNCLNGYHAGKPFKPEKVEIYYRDALRYLGGLQYKRKQITALLSLLDYAVKFNSLNMYISYNDLEKIFNVGNRGTVHKWLQMFKEDNILIPINEYTRKKRKQMQYRLLLPEGYYRVLQDDCEGGLIHA